MLHSHIERTFLPTGQCTACDEFWNVDQSQMPTLGRIGSLEATFYQLRNDMTKMETRHKKELMDRDNAVIVASTAAINAQVDARIATDSEIRLRSNLERLAAGTTSPIAERIRAVLDSYKEIE